MRKLLCPRSVGFWIEKERWSEVEKSCLGEHWELSKSPPFWGAFCSSFSFDFLFLLLLSITFVELKIVSEFFFARFLSQKLWHSFLKGFYYQAHRNKNKRKSAAFLFVLPLSPFRFIWEIFSCLHKCTHRSPSLFIFIVSLGLLGLAV